MKSSIQKVYEAPRAEVIEIESQGVLCASAGPASATSPVGDGGIHFGTNGGQW